MADQAKVVGEAKVTLEKENTKLKAEKAKLKVEKAELQQKLQESQDDLQIIQRNYATISGKVMGLEKEVKEAKERLCETTKNEAASRETTIIEAKQ